MEHESQLGNGYLLIVSVEGQKNRLVIPGGLTLHKDIFYDAKLMNSILRGVIRFHPDNDNMPEYFILDDIYSPPITKIPPNHFQYDEKL
jgi:hypothetical protein